jgi:hypothetical protein
MLYLQGKEGAVEGDEVIWGRVSEEAHTDDSICVVIGRCTNQGVEFEYA